METKSVEFQLFTYNNFEEAIFDEAYVKVEVILIKEDKAGNLTRIFEKVYDWKHFREFPGAAERTIELQVLTYDRNSEIVYASYGIYTRIDGYLASEGKSFTLSPGETEHVVEVKL